MLAINYNSLHFTILEENISLYNGLYQTNTNSSYSLCIHINLAVLSYVMIKQFNLNLFYITNHFMPYVDIIIKKVVYFSYELLMVNNSNNNGNIL